MTFDPVIIASEPESFNLISPLLILGILVIVSLFAGKLVKKVKLPSIIGFMIAGVFFGPSVFNIINHHVIDKMGFITEIALGFVAISIGLELSLRSLKSLGSGIIYIIFFESFGAFILTAVFVYAFTGDGALSLIFASIAPASAPAGTVAVIKEYKARGTLTQALYAVVGFDDGLGIIIFGFAAAAAKVMLNNAAKLQKVASTIQTSVSSEKSISFLQAMAGPLKEVILSIILGAIIAIIMCWVTRFFDTKGSASQDIFILLFGTILCSIGLSTLLHLSLILTNMVIGIIIVNTQPHILVHKFKTEASTLIPLLFVFFFALAGTNLHIKLLPSLGILGIIYILARAFGKIIGSWLGAFVGKSEEKIKKYLGLGILSQAGVAIGLALIVKHEFKGIGPIISKVGMPIQTMGDKIGIMAITTVTATCIIFEIIGPVLARYALLKAGEIKEADSK